MRYVLYKFVEAETAAAAIAKDPETPVHEACLKAGEQPDARTHTSLIGFTAPSDGPLPDEYWGESIGSRKRR